MKTKEELRKAHGTPSEFSEACKRAWVDGYITFQEAIEEAEDYERDYADAPGEDDDA